MWKIKRFILMFGFALVIILYSTSSISKVSISYSPQNPKAGDEVTFYVNIDEDAKLVKLWIQECKGNQCFLPEILEMEEINPGNFSVKYKLREDSTSVHYKVNVTFQDNSYTETEIHEFQVEPKTYTENEDNKNDTSGFEIYMAIFSIIVLSIILRRLSK